MYRIGDLRRKKTVGTVERGDLDKKKGSMRRWVGQ